MEGSRWRWSACAVLRCSMPWGSCGLTVRPSRGLWVSSWSRVLGDHYRGDDDLDWIPCLGLASSFFPSALESSRTQCIGGVLLYLQIIAQVPTFDSLQLNLLNHLCKSIDMDFI